MPLTFPATESQPPVYTASEAIDLEVLRNLDDPAAPVEESLMIELIDLYLDETSTLLTIIRESIDTANWESVKIKAHSLRGSSSNLGIAGMARLSDLLEHFDVSGPTRLEMMAELAKEFALVSEVLAEERQRRADANTDR
jgi:HPt (histidine-containing phosphotransfer) domain-containing protein